MPNRQVSKSEFKAKALEFFRLVESSGESLIVTDDAPDPLDLLRGSLLRYDNPMDPVGEGDWEAAQ
jgi:hypothetical protein